ncbi:S8 family serine peptidase [Sodalis sp. RH20]|uniref:S8 family serine peptidase n=1 Tax=unclassified Sodalis (in: enterobacteria) TaxID=2636512 RepID=UPI0039B38EB8
MIDNKEAEGDELVGFSIPFPSEYRISAEVLSGYDKCGVLWTDPIIVPECHWQPQPQKREINNPKGKLKIIEGVDNYIEIKFYDKGKKQLFEEKKHNAVLFYKYRKCIHFLPCFDREMINKKRKLSPIYNELRNFYRIDSELCNDELLALAQELECLDYVEYCALASKNKFAPRPDDDGPRPYDEARHASPHLPAPWYGDKDPSFDTPLNGPTPDFTPLQGYLNPGNGMNVRNAWARGATGNGATVRYMGSGVNPQHEDLIGNITVNSNRPEGNREHGTAGAGCIVAANNGFGVTGIAFGCRFFFHYNDIHSLDRIMGDLSPGDVIGINLSVGDSIPFPMVLVIEWWDRINWCVRAGATVAFAAGNGGVSVRNHPLFNDFGDSGGFMIGASYPETGRRTSFSNYNLYSTLNSWGWNVTTLGWGDLQNFDPPNRLYTSAFNGTSSATPLVTGALALVLGYARTRHHLTFNARQIFEIITQTGGREANGQDIGVRPNVAAALARVDEIAGPPPPQYPLWRVGVQYEVGDRVSHLGLNYVCRSRHVSNIGWQPQLAVTLWTRIP